MKKDRGFIGILLLIIIALVLLKYFFSFSIFDFAQSEEGREVLEYVKKVFVYLKELLVRAWNYIQ
jgi:hypothetical protein